MARGAVWVGDKAADGDCVDNTRGEGWGNGKAGDEPGWVLEEGGGARADLG